MENYTSDMVTYQQLACTLRYLLGTRNVPRWDVSSWEAYSCAWTFLEGRGGGGENTALYRIRRQEGQGKVLARVSLKRLKPRAG